MSISMTDEEEVIPRTKTSTQLEQTPTQRLGGLEQHPTSFRLEITPAIHSMEEYWITAWITRRKMCDDDELPSVTRCLSQATSDTSRRNTGNHKVLR